MNTLKSNGTLIAATTGALLTLVPVTAHQLGLLEHLPDPPGGVFDSDGITESKTAHPLGIPDGLLGLGSYSATLGLIAMGRHSRRARQLLAWKLAADGAMAAFNVVRQVVRFRKLCSWCTGTAVCTAVMVYAGRHVVKAEFKRVTED